MIKYDVFTVVYNDYGCDGKPWRIHKHGLDIGGFVYKRNADQTCTMLKDFRKTKPAP